MSYLLWQSQGAVRIASPRLVLRAAEVPLLREAQELCERLAQLERDTTQRLDAAEREARERAHAEGLAEGRAAAREDIATALHELAQAAASERARVREQIGTLALQVARKMLGSFAEDELLAALAATAAQDTLPTAQIKLTVHPDLCNAVRDRLARMTSDELRLEVRSDPACARDACRLETELGSVDASLDAQLSRLADAWSLPEQTQ